MNNIIKNEEDKLKIIDKYIDLFTGIKIHHFRDVIKIDGHTHNEKLVIYSMYEILKETNDDKVLLSKLRNKIKLAPSTITPIITSLENRGIIERVIDKEDRRNIYLKLSKKGLDFTNIANEKLNDMLDKYIDYMGIEDAEKFLYLIKKTHNFIKERNESNG